MDIDAYFDQYEAMDKDAIKNDLVKKAAAINTRFQELKEKLDGNYSEDMDLLHKVALSVLGADGRLDQAEYSLLCEIDDATSSPRIPIEDLRAQISGDKFSLYSSFSQTTYRIAKLSDSLFDEPISETFIQFLCGLSAYNGSVDSAEIAAIKSVIADQNETTNNGGTTSEEDADDSSDSSTDTDDDFESKPLVVARKGAKLSGSRDDGYCLSVGAIIHNPNNATAGKITIKLTIFDEDGGVLDSENEKAYYIEPNGYLNFGGEYEISDGEPTKFKIEAFADEYYDDVNINDQSFVGSNYRMGPTGFGSYKLSGIITSHYPEKADSIKFYFVFLDADEQVVGGTHCDVNDLYPESDTAFDTRIRADGSKAVKIRMSVGEFYSYL
jgi:hypothetical protein